MPKFSKIRANLMNILFFRSFLFCLASLGFTSCSLENGVAVSSPLKAGVRYEVRRAVGANDHFEPWELRSVYFVLKPEAPPMIAGTRMGSRGPLSVRTTAYCHSEADHLAYGHLSAMGKPLRYGMIRSAAADWSRFPLGTRFRIKGQPGVLYEVDDYGKALVGSNTIDIYCPTRTLMNRWGVRNVDIEVVSWGSFSDSLALMTERSHFPHVREMVREIYSRLGYHMPSLSMTTPETATMAPSTLLALGTSPSL
jgi:3D (Asp-Asp-Asp) domain-containing protein